MGRRPIGRPSSTAASGGAVWRPSCPASSADRTWRAPGTPMIEVRCCSVAAPALQTVGRSLG
eukprot:6642628-Alexandrium_andersonii.AAC.1